MGENRIKNDAEEKISQLAAIVEFSNDAIVGKDLNGIITSWNKAAERIYGYTESDVIGKSISLLTPPERFGEAPELLEKIKNGEQVEHYETVRLKKDGEPIDVSLTLSPIKNKEGQVIGASTIARNITDRKRAEQNLKENEAQLTALFEANPTGVVLIEQQSRKITRINSVAAKMIGLPREKIIGQMCHGFICPAERNCCPICDLSQEVDHSERILITANGTKIPILKTVGKILLDGKGYLLESFIDITDRRQAENKYRTLFESSMDAIMTLSPPEWKFTSGNSATIKLFGAKDEEEFISHGPWEVSPECQPDGQPSSVKARNMIEKAMQTGSNYFEWTHQTLEGEAFPATVLLSRIELEGKTLLQATVRDISDIKKAEEAILKAKNEWEDTFNSINDIVTLHDADFNIVHANKAAENVFGLAAQSLIGKKCYQVYHHKDCPPEGCPSCKVAKTGIPVTNEFYESTLDRYVEIKAYPRFDKKNNIVGVVHVVSDTTQRKRAEEQREKLLRELESVNGELKEFAYVVSHDLKAPLRGIKTLVGWFSTDYADKVDENGKEQLQLLSSRVDRMHNLIDGVLQYSRIGRTEEKPVNVDLNEIIAEAIDMVAAPQNITITVENELPKILCERTRITQVFQNLISNAVKYMDKPQGFVKIRCEDQQYLWRFSVEDNGPGIEEKYFEQIFKIFQMLHSRDEYESTGIGLTLVKKIVELYGGAVWVESAVGHGSTFYFTLPKLKAGVPDAKEPVHAIS